MLDRAGLIRNFGSLKYACSSSLASVFLMVCKKIEISFLNSKKRKRLLPALNQRTSVYASINLYMIRSKLFLKNR